MPTRTTVSAVVGAAGWEHTKHTASASGLRDSFPTCSALPCSTQRVGSIVVVLRRKKAAPL